MQIATFIDLSREEILAESVAYARTIVSLKDEDEAVLRNHLPKVLDAISADLRTPQSRTESIEKSHGLAPANGGDQETAAETHGLMRARSGLHIKQVVAEYRALRSCVLRLWTEASPPGPDAVRDVVRFNEAIDQALAESVGVYAAEVERWRQIFLGIVGHDLRAPLNAVALTTELLAQAMPNEFSLPIERLRRSAGRMTSLLDSLLEYNRVGMGGRMTIARLPVDLAVGCGEEVEIQRDAFPGARIELMVRGDTRGEFDGSRIREALGNLIGNAIKHGLPSEPVIVRLEGDERSVRLAVENAAAGSISSGEMELLFEPLRRGKVQRPGSDRSHLGLGLFIVRQIARAHGGEVHGHSESRKVRFTLTLPKLAPVSARALNTRL